VSIETARAALVALFLIGLGCGSSAATPDAGARAGDAAGNADGTLDGAADGLDGGGCNAIAQLADPVTTSCDPGAAPAAAGGTIADGTYLLTDSHFFGACESNVLSETLVVSQGTVQSITTDATTGMTTRGRFTYAVTSGSSTLSETETCPGAFTATVGFTATASRLTIFMRNALGSRMSAFELQ
jgi:hypothetical protein